MDENTAPPTEVIIIPPKGGCFDIEKTIVQRDFYFL
jgi:hypothetical protein